MKAAAFSIPGPKGSNDDRYLEPVEFDGRFIAAVADGVGGKAGGGRAAEIAIQVLRDSDRDSSSASFESLFHRACLLMRQEAENCPDWKKMATTMSAVRIADRFVEVAHVGDSRVYHLRKKGLVTRTKDQTEVAELVRQNVLSPRQAARYPRKNVILSYLSPNDDFELVRAEFSVMPGDVIIILTDGVYSAIKKTDFVEARSSTKDIGEFVESVKELVELRQPRDDSSLVAIEI